MNCKLQSKRRKNIEGMKDKKKKDCYFHTKLLEASVGKKERWKLKQKIYKTSIIPSGNSRMNHLGEGGREREREWYDLKKVKQRNSDSSVIVHIVQFYAIEHNFQSDYGIELKF